MPRRKSPYPEKSWKPDPVKWERHLKPTGKIEAGKTPREPKGGWMLFRLDTLEDAKQE